MSRALLFGKLPAHGDFVARGVEPALRETLDRWLSASLAEARAALGTDFEARYDSAPAWRFATQDGARWLAGALAPSMDAVGRRFPLLVACESDERDAPALAARCEDAIYQAFAQTLDADALHAGLLALVESEGAPPLPGWWSAGNEAFGGGVLAGDRPTGLLRVMLGAGGETA